jgi:DNA-binding NtrC family response regulator
LPPSADTDTEIITLDELERRYIARAVRLLKGNKARAAQLLGCDRRTLYRRLEKSNGSAMDHDGLGKRGAIQ